MKDAVATMGGLLPDDTHGRDAVHVAVFSARSAVTLYPGQRVAIVSHGEKDSEVGPTGEVCAMVDPFLDHAVMPGERFWAYLFPRTITALAHRWRTAGAIRRLNRPLRCMCRHRPSWSPRSG